MKQLQEKSLFIEVQGKVADALTSRDGEYALKTSRQASDVNLDGGFRGEPETTGHENSSLGGQV